MVIMMGLMLIGALVWGGHHGMPGGHDRDGHAEGSMVKEEAGEPCQQPDCNAEGLKEDLHQGKQGENKEAR